MELAIDKIKKMKFAPRLVAQRQMQGFLASVIWGRVSACTPVTPAVSYLSIGLAGCSVGPGINCGACKLVRTPRVIKKKKRCSSEEMTKILPTLLVFFI